jgi:RNA polymerase subunit RPABC4/transcription elongation factor Spt4
MLGIKNMEKYICPVCGYHGLAENPGPDPKYWGSHEICPSCGWQFGYNNPNGLLQYRALWVEAGANWFFPEKQPRDWRLVSQLANIGLTVQDVLQPAKAA